MIKTSSITRLLAALGLALSLAGAAQAQTVCLSRNETQQLIASGQILDLPAILRMNGFLPTQLVNRGGVEVCMRNGKLQYKLQISLGAAAMTVWIDAQTGKR